MSKRLLTLKGKTANFESEINVIIKEQFCRVLDVMCLDWNKTDRCFYLALLVQEEVRFVCQNCVVFEKKQMDQLGRDLDDFSAVMMSAKNVPYSINLVRVFKMSHPKGDSYLAYVLYED
ncbi:MAG: hypothetical protein QHH05_02485 [Syntrophomonadaceae bacterium]|nr:hypothetical protein [Syntrophomonadaceae bacterium]